MTYDVEQTSLVPKLSARRHSHKHSRSSYFPPCCSMEKLTGPIPPSHAYHLVLIPFYTRSYILVVSVLLDRKSYIIMIIITHHCLGLGGFVAVCLHSAPPPPPPPLQSPVLTTNCSLHPTIPTPLPLTLIYVPCICSSDRRRITPARYKIINKLCY